MHLHGNRRLVCLQIGFSQQILAHGLHHCLQQFAHTHHPAIQRRAPDLHARFTLQNRRLSIQRQVITIFWNHGVDHHRVAGQTLLDNARLPGSHGDRALFAAAAGALFALGHTDEIAGRLHVQLFAFVVADDGCFAAARLAGLLITANHLLHTRQILRQPFAPGMRLTFTPRRLLHPLASRFGFDLVSCHAGLFVGQQLQL